MYYKVTLVVENPGLVGIDLDVPPSHTATQPVLLNSHLPKQNMMKIKSTQPRYSTNRVAL